MSQKICSKCKEVKGFDQFHRNASAKDGLNRLCKACVKLKLDAWRAANPEKHAATCHRWYKKNKPRLNAKSKATSRLYKYGLTPEALQALCDSHKWRCGICSLALVEGATNRQDAVHVDHDHATGKVRGILCQACNFALGAMQDDTARLRAALAYLERHAGRAT